MQQINPAIITWWHVPRCPCCLFTCLWDDCQWTALDSTEFFLTSFSSAKELCMQLWSPPLSEFSTFCLDRSALSAFQRCVGAAAFFSLRSWHARRRLVSTHLSLSNTRPKWVQTCDTPFSEVLTWVKPFCQLLTWVKLYKGLFYHGKSRNTD